MRDGHPAQGGDRVTMRSTAREPSPWATFGGRTCGSARLTDFDLDGTLAWASGPHGFGPGRPAEWQQAGRRAWVTNREPVASGAIWSRVVTA